MEILLLFAAIIGVMYFLMIRPQQKRMKEHQMLVDSLGEGRRIILTSGLFATIKHVGDTQAIVELAPGVEITILRQVIMRAVKADEEEFEYADEADEDGVAEPVNADAEAIDPLQVPAEDSGDNRGETAS
ncbi:MAG: preprotein translocase subunit YajC [Propionibacteriaceae bacterium]|nr:preprotein translocase subunit YajC [Propionibacteriaceae bacterium]